MTRRIEIAYPFLLAVLAAILWWNFKPVFPPDEKEFLAAGLSIGAILTGFITTAKAILVALPSDSIMGRLRASGYIDDLILYLAQALYSCFIFSIYCLAGFFLLETNKQVLTKVYGVIWIFLGTFSAVAFYRVSNFLFKIIRFNPDRI
ncbi:hypothetical protein [Duganella fentianensis]|uniref:hypothetical protein n=1 Tax=Duganella fentianensis TaxID=2692177 RepID=UPI0032B1B7AD